MTLAIELLLWFAVTIFAAWGWASLMVWIAACPNCRKGALCADCLAASQEIRPKPEPTKEAA